MSTQKDKLKVRTIEIFPMASPVYKWR